jgi:hypothetical protein
LSLLRNFFVQTNATAIVWTIETTKEALLLANTLKKRTRKLGSKTSKPQSNMQGKTKRQDKRVVSLGC